MRAWRHAPRSGAAVSDSPSGPEPEPTITLDECQRTEPELTGDRVLIQVQASVLGAPERVPGASDIIPGGAAVGTIVQAGEHAGHLIGQRVIVGPEQACGECDICRRGEPVLCPHGEHLGRDRDGTLARYVSARARWVCALEDELSSPQVHTPAAALLAREAAWAYAMFARAGVAPGEPVFILGHNVVARFLVQIAVAKGVRPMVLCGSQDAASETAPDTAPAWPPHWPVDWIVNAGGVPVTVTPNPATDPATTIRQSAERAASENRHGRRPWFVFETSTQAHARRAALALVVPGGKLTLLARRAIGHSTASAPLPLDLVLDADATITGMAGAHPDLFPEVVALAVRGDLDIASAARIVPINERPEAFEPLREPIPQEWVVTISD